MAKFEVNNVSVSTLLGYVKDGTIANAKIEQSIDPALDREALRVIRMMPKWKPGVRNGIPMKVEYELPINFRIDYGGNVTG